MIHINVLTGFPNFLNLIYEINYNLNKCLQNNIIKLNILNLRENPNIYDDNIFGGGNMALSLVAFEKFNLQNSQNIYYLNPDGVALNQSMIQYMSTQKEITLISGRYEGIDERIISKYNICNISIGDYILSNGDIPIAIIIDALSRFLYLSSDTIKNESFHDQMLDNFIYTRPQNDEIPSELLSGNHKLIEDWKLKNRLIKTIFYRPDLLLHKEFNQQEKKCIKEILLSLNNVLKNNSKIK